ncbi:MAG: 50S ribosomal protein L15 [bacterium]|nr:50S ribosomal protein L15 [bacterium]
MQIAEITKLAGARKRRRRIGRGRGSGSGKTSGRGHGGGGSRAGWKQRGFAEGGQMPLFRRIPKRGFNNANFRTAYSVVNVGDLDERFEDGANVTPAALVEVGLVRNLKLGVKILGDGVISKKLNVRADRFSKQAAEKIRSAGGEARTE